MFKYLAKAELTPTFTKSTILLPHKGITVNSIDIYRLNARLMKSASKIEANEFRATMMSFGVIFLLMVAYYILRPVRDAMASDWSDATVSALWTFTFLFSFVATGIYGLAVSKVKLKYVVISVYAFFAASFIAVYLLANSIEDSVLVNMTFYVWVSVFSLFQVSVFWSFMCDLYSKEQSTRLFGFITTGASVGAIVGPAIPAIFAGTLGISKLLLVGSLILVMTIPAIMFLQTLKARDLGNETQADATQMNRGLGGSALAGYKIFVQSPYLMAIGAFIFLYAGIGSFVYFELKNLLAEFPIEKRTQIWALIDVATNSLTIVLGLFVTSRLTERLGLAFTLALIPIMVLTGLLTVAIIPLVWIVVGLQIFRRAGNYGVTRPAREMLFTVVNRETRFKVKQVIDVVVYRGGDVFWGWSFTGLTAVVGLSLTAVALVGAGVSAIWAVLGIYLGRHFSRREPLHAEQEHDI
ncbi:MAG: NTP/NDP exchange transporter [Candidatus Micropelagos thuwalensis]